MSQTPSEAIKRFGTDAPVTPMRTLRAGALSVEFDQGALRFIKVNGTEAIRNIAFVVRDRDWGTYNPSIDNLSIEERDDGFDIRFDAVCKDDTQELHYSAHIEANAEGTLTFSGTGKAISDFVTNRTGFVVLHPVVGVSGYPVEVERVDGSIEQSEFPVLVDPVQPFKDLRALTHEVSPGVTVTCRMQGDTFEMEDHRQWGDASYKTYVRPIGLPWPFTIAAGEVIEQSVTLTIDGANDAPVSADDAPIEIEIGAEHGTMPRIGLGLEPQHADSAIAHADLVKALGAQYLVCWHDLRAGHDAESLAKARTLGEAIDAELVLEAVIPCDDYRAEIETLARQAAQAGVQFAAVSVSPAEYLRSFMPGSTWPDLPDLADVYDALRAAFPGVTLGGGMFSFFPELNRKRPPTAHLDYITHTSNVITHASDDITVTENLEALAFIIETCRSFADNKPYQVGPSAIAMRFNPYGAKTMDNPNNERIAMARMDPRQRGLINAVWTLGYVAHMARGDLTAIALQAPTGEFGLIYTPQAWAQPWFDDSDARVYPAYPVVADLARASGAARLNTTSSFGHDVEALAYRRGDTRTLWLANLTAEPRTVTVQGLSIGGCTARRLDSESFEACVREPTHFERATETLEGQSVTLGAYALVRIDA